MMGNNKKGLAVMRLVALHPLVMPQSLEHIANNTSNDYVISSVVSNEKTPVYILEREVNKNNYDWMEGVQYDLCEYITEQDLDDIGEMRVR